MTDIPNPICWCFNCDEDAEWWRRGGNTRNEAIAAGTGHYHGDPFWIAECRSMVPSFNLFDADDICERLSEDECWWEDGWTGEPDADAKRDLEERLKATFIEWFAEKASLDGASLDQISSERITPETPQ